MKMKNKQTMPKWFDGDIYKEGSVVQNPFSKEEYELNNMELSMYDFIIGINYLFEMGQEYYNNKIISEHQKALRWFRVNNPEAYMALLD